MSKLPDRDESIAILKIMFGRGEFNSVLEFCEGWVKHNTFRFGDVVGSMAWHKKCYAVVYRIRVMRNAQTEFKKFDDVFSAKRIERELIAGFNTAVPNEVGCQAAFGPGSDVHMFQGMKQSWNMITSWLREFTAYEPLAKILTSPNNSVVRDDIAQGLVDLSIETSKEIGLLPTTVLPLIHHEQLIGSIAAHTNTKHYSVLDAFMQVEDKFDWWFVTNDDNMEWCSVVACDTILKATIPLCKAIVQRTVDRPCDSVGTTTITVAKCDELAKIKTVMDTEIYFAQINNMVSTLYPQIWLKQSIKEHRVQLVELLGMCDDTTRTVCPEEVLAIQYSVRIALHMYFALLAHARLLRIDPVSADLLETIHDLRDELTNAVNAYFVNVERK